MAGLLEEQAASKSFLADESFSVLVEQDDGHSSYGVTLLEEEEDLLDDREEERETEQDSMNFVLSRPIVVGYAFGPKKMSTMCAVMAEASKTRLTTNMPLPYPEQEDTEPTTCHSDNDRVPDDSESGAGPDSSCWQGGSNAQLLTKEVLSSLANDKPVGKSSLGGRDRSSYFKPPTQVMFTLDHHYSSNESSTEIADQQPHGSIVRQLRSSSPSNSSWGSTGTRTASTAASIRTPISMGGSCTSNSFKHATATTDSSSLARTANSGKKHSRSRNKKYPIRVSFVPLDPEIPLEEQHGGIDVILHKLTEDILLLSQLSFPHPELKSILKNAEQSPDAVLKMLHLRDSEEAAVRRVHRLCQFQKQHGCSLVDDPIRVQTLMSRADIASVLEQCLCNVVSLSGLPVRAPKYAVVFAGRRWQSHEENGEKAALVKLVEDSVNHAQLKFPLIVKPLIAAGTKASHSMAVVTHESGLEKIVDRVPCLLQEYTNHNAVLYKVYVLGDFVSVHKRRSLPNLPTKVDFTEETSVVVEFDSQRPYPRFTDFVRVDHAEEASQSANDQSSAAVGVNRNSNNPVVTTDEVRPIVHALRTAFGLEIFGFDVLVSSTTKDENDQPHLLVVDVNYFPSYKEVPNFPALLAKFLTGRAISSRIGPS